MPCSAVVLAVSEVCICYILDKETCWRWVPTRYATIHLVAGRLWCYSKLGLTMVRPSLQSALEPPALDLPPVIKHVCCNSLRFLMSGELIWPFQLKIVSPVTHSVGNVYTIFDFITFLSYEPLLDGQARCVLWHIGWPHDKSEYHD